jgi:hypothetical protein
LSQLANSAHVQGMTGTFVAPAQSPYDRQMLREHVETLASRVSPLTLGLHGRRWIITQRLPADGLCATCAQFLGRLSCRGGDDATVTCIECAMHPAGSARMGGHDA